MQCSESVQYLRNYLSLLISLKDSGASKSEVQWAGLGTLRI